MRNKKKYQTKKVTVTGFTKGLRELRLDVIKTKLSKRDWEVQEYVENGLFKSYVILKREAKFRFLKTSDVLIVLATFLFLYAIFSIDQKTDPGDGSKRYFSTTLEDARSWSKGEKNRFTQQYLSNRVVGLNHSQEFSDCVSHMTWTKRRTITLNKVAGWCYKELNNEYEMKYTNLDGLRGQFSYWDGAHLNVQRFIKKNMNDEESYKHHSTNYRLVLHQDSPHMVVTSIFSGKNGFGGTVKKSLTAKVDVHSGAILEIVN